MSASLVPLSQVVEIERKEINPENIPDGTFFVGLENITSDGAFHGVQRLVSGDLASSKFKFTSEHVLYGKLRPYLKKIVRADFDGVCSTDILPLRPKASVDRDYLYHWLRLPRMIDLANSRATGVNLPRLSPTSLSNFEILLPPLTEQKAIAAILDKTDSLRRKRREALVKVDKLAQAIFLEMFGHPVDNPKNWPMHKLGEVGQLDRGKSKHRPRNAPELYGGSIPFVQTGDIANADGVIKTFKQTYSDLGLRQSKLWPRGTLCITIAANIAKVAVVDFDTCFPDSVVGFSPGPNITTEYVQTWFSFVQKSLEDYAPESAQKNINLQILRDLDVPIPSKQSQTEFAKIVRSVRGQRDRGCRQLGILESLFSTLQDHAFGNSRQLNLIATHDV